MIRCNTDKRVISSIVVSISDIIYIYIVYYIIYIYIGYNYNVFVSTKMYLLRQIRICNCIYYDFFKVIAVVSITTKSE